jgi:rSAM/selenodomain-associated transferase 2
MELSIVIPVLNEERRIAGALAAAGDVSGVHEILVVDGGSNDATVEVARGAGYRVIESARGRARQLNAGAAAATGDTLLFLHADVELPASATAVVEETLRRPGVVAGAFRTWHVAERWGQRRGALLHLADLRSRYSRLPYGDQALFLRRQVFEEIGGFPELELMEDLALGRLLRRRGRIAISSLRVRVSGRRFEAAPLYQTLLVNVFPFLYSVGVPPAVLARLYGDPR